MTTETAYRPSTATFRRQRGAPTLTLRIDTRNHAFYSEDGDRYDPGTELARILRDLADTLEHDTRWTYRPLADASGNTVGKAELI